jgi:hypothetical protein
MVDFSQVHACVLHVPKDEDAQKAVEAALSEDANNSSRFSRGSVTHGVAPSANGLQLAPERLRMGIFVSKMWKPGRTLRVLLRGGTPKVRAKVMENAVVWSKYANIKFEFVSSLPAEIRVGFKQGNGSWSWLGTDALTKPDYEDTMNFGWFDDNTNDTEFSRTTLHEFGHALGCVHEHSQPYAKIEWNKEAVYAYHLQNDGWGKEQVDFQIFSHYSSDDVSATAYDTLSIMHYPIDKSWTLNGISVGWNTYLSDQDKAYIREMYPPSHICASTGVVNTMSVRPWQNPAHENRIAVAFSPPCQSLPIVLLGLNWLDIGSNANVRISADLVSAQNDGMTINLHSWADTAMYSSGCAWLRLASEDNDLQTGTFSTMDDHLWYRPQTKTSRRIRFTRPYTEPPTVLVWLNSLDVGKDANCRIKAHASDISIDGFTVNIDSWAETSIYSGRVSFLTFSSGRSDICGGTYTTSDVRNWWDPRPENSAQISFSKRFEKPPRVYMALNSMDMQHGRNLRIRLSAENITTTGMTWHIDSWGDTQMYLGGATYVAIACD